MAKYDIEFKMKLINEYLEGTNSIKGIARKYNIESSILFRWKKLFENKGKSALNRSRKNNKYFTDFKLKVVGEYLTTDISYEDLAIKYDINNSTIITRWKLDYEKDGIIGLQPKQRGRPSIMPKSKEINTKAKDTRTKQEKLDDKLLIKELKTKLEYAEAENAILKKFHALGIPIPESMLEKK